MQNVTGFWNRWRTSVLFTCRTYEEAPELAQVTTTILDDITDLESRLVLIGAGSSPRSELFKGQVDLQEDRLGGVKVSQLTFVVVLAYIKCSEPGCNHLPDRSGGPRHASLADNSFGALAAHVGH